MSIIKTGLEDCLSLTFYIFNSSNRTVIVKCAGVCSVGNLQKHTK